MTAAAWANQDEVVKRLQERFGQSVSSEQGGNGMGIVAAMAALHDVLHFLKTTEDLSFTMLTDLFPVDYGDRSPRFEIVYLLNSMKLKSRLVVKVRLGEGERVPTLSDVWAAAEWLEREAYDMFGIAFEGHPDPRRILMTEGFDGYPLRKDFPLEGHDFEQPFKVTLEE